MSLKPTPDYEKREGQKKILSWEMRLRGTRESDLSMALNQTYCGRMVFSLVVTDKAKTIDIFDYC